MGITGDGSWHARRHGGQRFFTLACAALLVATTAAACSSGRPDPRDTAENLAAALSKASVKGVPGAAQAQDDLTTIVQGMSTTRATVTVGDVSTDGDTATADLKTRWSFAGDDWAYTTQAKLSYVKDAWQVDWSPDIVAPDLAAGERLTISSAAAARGEILGADDEPIVTERTVERIGIDKSRITAAEAAGSAKALARLIDIDPDTFAERVEAAGPQAFVIGIVVRADSGATLSDDALAGIPGAAQLQAQLPLAPTRTFGQPMLGVVGEATAEIVEKSQGAVRSGDMVGLSGLARRYDARLRGTPGVSVMVLPADDGAKSRELFTSEPVAGKPLRTTIDLDLQGTADEILADVKPASAIVAIRPSTGEIVALASGPGGKGEDTAAAGRYAPGSTFKLVTSLAFLRSGLEPSTTVPCTASITVDGRAFTNYSDYPSSAIGDIPLRSAIANSCNTAMIATRDQAPQDDLAGAAAALGLGPDLDLGYPAFLGSVPAKASGTERAASMIGQGRIEASPLSMAVVAASIAKGERVTPTLLADASTKPAEAAADPLTSGEAKQLRELFRAVVTDGSGRFLSDVPGGPVSAKTGTAEYGSDTPPRTHAWMIATQDDLAVAVFVGDGESGSQTAGPLLEELLRSAS
ncbi:penicillin-binding transpeptidase domain-containing protein [Aeromicrobium stalagmiti]|uniref:penicillin-binding transpeptidase domain-containing protein n=1 Tax=Aeromicrobium stalagmiti TaxID=2738988 RepID=UPI0015692C9C|nr:penicillin-binding transpeptidase domain-containing protein [Aeromicrobium stalagmiti]NRQ50379.1 penicillin-binding protein [Aeromicrobium stalagmiti]